MTSPADPRHDQLLAEYSALSTGAVLFDVGDRALLELTGRDRASFLHNFCTNDIKRLQPGEGCEAFLTNIKGRILEHLFVFADDTSLWIDGTPGYEEAVSAHLDRYLITEDVQIHRRSAGRAAVWLVGRSATDLFQLLFGDLELPLKALQQILLAVGDGEGVPFRRFDLGGFPGWRISGPPSAVEDVVSRLESVSRQNGAGLRRGSAELREALRIESGLPRYGVDITDEHLAQECRRTAAAISFSKGCYLGQEPIARIDALGHVNRELCVLEGAPDGNEIPSGTPLFDQSGSGVGTLTSVAWHPRTRSTWGLGVLKRSASTEGMGLFAGEGTARQSMTVHAPLTTERASSG